MKNLVSDVKNPFGEPPFRLRHIHLSDNLTRFCIRSKTFVARKFRQLLKPSMSKLQIGHRCDPLRRAIRQNLEYLVFPDHEGWSSFQGTGEQRDSTPTQP